MYRIQEEKTVDDKSRRYHDDLHRDIILSFQAQLDSTSIPAVYWPPALFRLDDVFFQRTGDISTIRIIRLAIIITQTLRIAVHYNVFSFRAGGYLLALIAAVWRLIYTELLLVHVPYVITPRVLEYRAPIYLIVRLIDKFRIFDVFTYARIFHTVY